MSLNLFNFLFLFEWPEPREKRYSLGLTIWGFGPPVDMIFGGSQRRGINIISANRVQKKFDGILSELRLFCVKFFSKKNVNIQK